MIRHSILTTFHALIAGLWLFFVGITGSLAGGEPAKSQILDVFPKSIVQMPVNRQGQTVFSSNYMPSGSVWDERLDEKHVFQMEITHQQDNDSSFALRVGKGGQIYSLRGPFGESVPPSWRAGSHETSPWNDEVWQFVAVCTKYNGTDASLSAGELPSDTIVRMKDSPYRNSFFIHNSGAYIRGDSALRSLYCPLLGSEVITDDRCYRTLNWGLVPQIKTVHRSPLLYYTQVRDVGDGIIELTWVVHNFSVRDDVVFDHLNAPWGGTRVTSLPFRYVSSPESELMERDEILHQGIVEAGKTGGWNLSCASEAMDSPSLALVFGKDKHLESERRRMAAGEMYCQFKPALYRDWRASAPLYNEAWKDWETRPANSFRNYDVVEVIPGMRLVPGATIWYRSYLVVNRKDKAVELAKMLVDKVDYGLVHFDPETTPKVPVFVREGKVFSGNQPHSQKETFETVACPVSGTKPLFLIQNTESGNWIITTDPYYFVEKEKQDFDVPLEHPHHDYYKDIYGYSLDENNTHWQSLLGFGYESKPEVGSWKRLSTLLDRSMFPQADRYHLDLWVGAANANE